MKLIAKINFGEILGKHSDITEEFKWEWVSVVTEDQEFLKEVKKKNIKLEFGYNPFEYYTCSKCGEKLDPETDNCKNCNIMEIL